MPTGHRFLYPIGVRILDAFIFPHVNSLIDCTRLARIYRNYHLSNQHPVVNLPNGFEFSTSDPEMMQGPIGTCGLRLNVPSVTLIVH